MVRRRRGDTAWPRRSPHGPDGVRSGAERAEELEKQAAAQFEEGKKADETGDRMELASALLAVTLFFAGVGTLFRQDIMKLLLLVVAGVMLVLGEISLTSAVV